jgi:mRNA-degrading endonuclease RelE of RelBE toxin-antitoxin system
MKVIVRKRFISDVAVIRSPEITEEVKFTLQYIGKCKGVEEIHEFKILRGHKNFARIKLGDYRMGVWFSHQTIIFICFKHRSNVYSFFP